MNKGIYSFTSKKYWVFLRPNMTLSKKSTNSRMGKGKGNPTRRAFQTKIYTPLLEFQGVNPYSIKAFVKYLIFKTRIGVTVLFKPIKNINNIGKKQSVKILFKKYNFF